MTIICYQKLLLLLFLKIILIQGGKIQCDDLVIDKDEPFRSITFKYQQSEIVKCWNVTIPQSISIIQFMLKKNDSYSPLDDNLFTAFSFTERIKPELLSRKMIIHDSIEKNKKTYDIGFLLRNNSLILQELDSPLNPQMWIYFQGPYQFKTEDDSEDEGSQKEYEFLLIVNPITDELCKGEINEVSQENHRKKQCQCKDLQQFTYHCDRKVEKISNLVLNKEISIIESQELQYIEIDVFSLLKENIMSFFVKFKSSYDIELYEKESYSSEINSYTPTHHYYLEHIRNQNKLIQKLKSYSTDFNIDENQEGSYYGFYLVFAIKTSQTFNITLEKKNEEDCPLLVFDQSELDEKEFNLDKTKKGICRELRLTFSGLQYLQVRQNDLTGNQENKEFRYSFFASESKIDISSEDFFPNQNNGIIAKNEDNFFTYRESQLIQLISFDNNEESKTIYVYFIGPYRMEPIQKTKDRVLYEFISNTASKSFKILMLKVQELNIIYNQICKGSIISPQGSKAYCQCQEEGKITWQCDTLGTQITNINEKIQQIDIIQTQPFQYIEISLRTIFKDNDCFKLDIQSEFEFELVRKISTIYDEANYLPGREYINNQDRKQIMSTKHFNQIIKQSEFQEYSKDNQIFPNLVIGIKTNENIQSFNIFLSNCSPAGNPVFEQNDQNPKFLSPSDPQRKPTIQQMDQANSNNSQFILMIFGPILIVLGILIPSFYLIVRITKNDSEELLEQSNNSQNR